MNRLIFEAELCESCPLAIRKGFKSPVNPKWHARSSLKYMFVSESPGYEEERQGETLVGKGGQLIRKKIVKAGISLDDCLFVSSCLCSSKGFNDRFSPPIEEEFLHCIPHAINLIRRYRPGIVISLGGTSLSVLHKSKNKVKVTTAHGKILSLKVTTKERILVFKSWAEDYNVDISSLDLSVVTDNDIDFFMESKAIPLGYDEQWVKTPIMPIVHPSFVLREGENGRWSESVDFDLQEAYFRVEGNKEDISGSKNYRWINSVHELEEFTNTIISKFQSGEIKFASCDIETSEELGDAKKVGLIPLDLRNRIITIQFTYENDSGVSIMVNHRDSVFNNASNFAILRNCLVRIFENVDIVGQNFQFDAKTLRCRLGIKKFRLVGDTMLMFHWISAGTGLSLGLNDIGARFLGTGRHKKDSHEWRERNPNGTFEDMPLDLALQYSCLDGDSRVQIEDGSWEKISTLVKRKYCGKVKSFDFTNGKVVNRSVINWFRQEVRQKEWFKIITRNTEYRSGSPIGPVLTPDHQVLTNRGKVRVDEIKIGNDSILTAERTFSKDQLSVFIGSILGDGGYERGSCNKKAGFRFGQGLEHKEYAEWKALVFEKFLPKRLKTRHDGYIRFSLPFSSYIYELSKEYPTWSQNKHRYRKAIITEKLLVSLGDLGLAVWYQDDGCLVGSGGKKTSSRIYCSKLLEEEINILLKWANKKFGSGVSYSIRGRFLQFTGLSFEKFHETIDRYIHPSMAYKGITTVGRELPNLWEDGGPFYDTIIKTIPYKRGIRGGGGVRYCLTVEKTGNFLTQIGFVSNCGDTDVTFQCYKIIKDQLQKEGRWNNYFDHFHGVHGVWDVVYNLEWSGMPVNKVVLDHLATIYPEIIMNYLVDLHKNPFVLHFLENKRRKYNEEIDAKNAEVEEHNKVLEEEVQKYTEWKNKVKEGTLSVLDSGLVIKRPSKRPKKYKEKIPDLNEWVKDQKKWFNPESYVQVLNMWKTSLSLPWGEIYGVEYSDIDDKKNPNAVGEVPKTNSHNREVLINFSNKKLNEAIASKDQNAIEYWKCVNSLMNSLETYKSSSKSYGTYVKGIYPFIIDKPGEKDDWNPNSRCFHLYTPYADFPRPWTLHPSYHLAGTETGRMSSSDPNGQSFPSEAKIKEDANVKSCYVSLHEGKGGIIVQPDYSQIEVKGLVMISGEKEMEDAINAGEDIHMFVASLVNGCPIEDISSEMRKGVKTITFGIIYGQSIPAMAQILGIPNEEAQDIQDRLLSRFPNIKRFIEKCQREAIENEKVSIPTGRVCFLPHIRSDTRGEVNKALRNAVNAPIQGFASDLCAQAFGRSWKKIQIAKLDALPFSTVHDSQSFDTGPGCFFDVIEIQYYEMVMAPSRFYSWITLRPDADFDVGVNWGSMVGSKLFPNKDGSLDHNRIDLIGKENRINPVLKEMVTGGDDIRVLDYSPHPQKKEADKGVKVCQIYVERKNPVVLCYGDHILINGNKYV